MNGDLPVLLLTGESGVGKTATVRAICHERSVSIIEWINPTATHLTHTDYSNNSTYYSNTHTDYSNKSRRCDDFEPSQSTQFKEFILRSCRYPSLNLIVGGGAGTCQSKIIGDGAGTCQSKFDLVIGGGASAYQSKLILVEDLPNTFLRDPTQFHALLRSFNQSRSRCDGLSRGRGVVTPLVFILSDSGGGNASERALFPPALRAELRLTGNHNNESTIFVCLMIISVFCIISLNLYFNLACIA